jgi:hypothetical protein
MGGLNAELGGMGYYTTFFFYSPGFYLVSKYLLRGKFRRKPTQKIIIELFLPAGKLVGEGMQIKQNEDPSRIRQIHQPSSEALLIKTFPH